MIQRLGSNYMTTWRVKPGHKKSFSVITFQKLNVAWLAVCEDPDVVVIHDAVRPFVDEKTLKKVVGAAQEHGVCI